MGFLHWLDGTAMAEAIRSSIWIFPTMEVIHVVAITLVVGSIARLDLRLAGLVSRDRAITEVSEEMLPWTWASFVVAVLFGALLFAGQPIKYLGVAFFDVKMILILLAGINMLAFQYLTFKGVGRWDRKPTPPVAVCVAGSLSLAFWVSVIICGRFIGFV